LITQVLKTDSLIPGLSYQDDIWRTTLDGLISRGISSGANFVEIFLERSDSLNILAEQSIITNVSPSLGLGAGIRVFRDKKDGFVSTNDLSESGLLKALINALSMLGLEINELSCNKFSGLGKLKDYGIEKNNWLKKTPSISDISNKLISANSKLEIHCNKEEVRRSSFSRSWQEVLISASDGTFVRDIRLHQTTGLNVLVSDKEHRASIGRRYGSSDKPNDLSEWDEEHAAQEISESSAKMLYADYVDAGQMPAILSNKFGGVIFHEACGHLLETTQIERGTTPFSNSLGKKIAHESLSAVDEGAWRDAFGTISVDDEGMEPENTLLIENGILRNFLSDRAGELRTGHKRTGSGRRQSYSFAAASRMRNTYIKAGNHKPSELIESIDQGIYCKSMGGGSVGPTGQFNFSVEEGYLIENGKLTKPVKGATLIGEAKEILPKISLCADDLDIAPGFCGSVSGAINVTVGQPHIKVDSITIGGR
tara:strand:+ start:210 stop:1655 length:1446 start_codon:yes stop_codon:yes gene_type:complete